MRIYQLSVAGVYGRNPDQRLQEDTRLLGDFTADLGCGLVYALLQIIAFVGVLWALSAQVAFGLAGYHIAIPVYMVWCAIAYAAIGSGLTWLVGRPLIALNAERYAREAEFRFALVRVNEGLRASRCRAARRTNTATSITRLRPSSTPCGAYLPHLPISRGSRRARDGCRWSFRSSSRHQPISAAP